MYDQNSTFNYTRFPVGRAIKLVFLILLFNVCFQCLRKCSQLILKPVHRNRAQMVNCMNS